MTKKKLRQRIDTHFFLPVNSINSFCLIYLTCLSIFERAIRSNRETSVIDQGSSGECYKEISISAHPDYGCSHFCLFETVVRHSRPITANCIKQGARSEKWRLERGEFTELRRSVNNCSLNTKKKKRKKMLTLKWNQRDPGLEYARRKPAIQKDSDTMVVVREPQEASVEEAYRDQRDREHRRPNIRVV